MNDHTPELRKSPRQKTLLRGKLYFNNRLNVVDCLIRDISDCGARLIFSEAVAIPDQIELYIPQKDQTLFVTVAWRQGPEVGVAFEQASNADHKTESGDLAERFAQLEKEVAAIKRFLKKLKTEAGPESEVA
jgi:hypothetical protein